MNRRWVAALFCAAWGVAAAQTASAEHRAQQGLLDFTAAERARIASHGPWPPRKQRDLSNRAEGRLSAVAWGRQLFVDRRLSGDGHVSCASCHDPSKAFQDGRAVAQARAHGPAGQRNTPSLLNSQGARWLGWDGAHDSLWAASRAPLLASDEMGHSVASLAQRVRAEDSLGRGYRSAFGQPVPASDEQLLVDMAKALAAYQATLRTPRTPFDAFRDAMVRGDFRAAATFPLSAQRGLRLFIGHGRCSVCHAGPAFTNGEFADIGIPFFVAGGVDPGRHAGLLKLQGSPWSRLGLYNDAAKADPQAVTTRHVVIEPRHFGEFRVPGLRNLSQTAPYMHNGSLPTLEAVVQHYSQLDENRLHADGERILRRLDLSPDEAADLAAFLRSLGRQEPLADR